MLCTCNHCYLGGCSVSFLWDSNIPSCRKLLKQESNHQLKIASGSLWNWQDWLGPPCMSKQSLAAKKTLRKDKLQKILRPYQLPEASKTGREAWKRFRSINWGTWKGHSPNCWAACRLRSVLHIPSFGSCHLCWGGFWWCGCLWVISASVSNLNTTH